MQPEYVSVGDLFSREAVYIVPLFQRPYVWDEGRWQLLWEDVIRVAEEALSIDEVPRRHFLGSIVLQQRPNGVTQVPRREVIDGQQRLTTLQVLLKATTDALETDIVTADAARPLGSLLRHPFAAKTDLEGSFKVWPTNVDRTRFRGIMEGNIIIKPMPDDRFAGAYSFFKRELRNWLDAESPDPEVRRRRSDAIARTLRQHLWLIALNLTDEDQAQVIFESLNARGTKLGPGDLIKNVLLRRAQDEGAQTSALYEEYWKPFDEEPFWQQNVGAGYTARPRLDFFLQQALTVLSGKMIPMSSVYDNFVSYLRSTKDKQSTTDHLKRISDLSRVARNIFEAKESSPNRTLVAAARIQAMDFMTALPVLMVLLADTERDPHDVATSAMYLESFLVRRTVCSLNTGMYGIIFVDIMKELARAKTFTEAMAKILLSEQSGSKRWPTDDEFGAAWSSFPLYKTLRRARLTMILRALEASLRNPHLTDDVSISLRLHVEHVMPQSWQQWWELPSGKEDTATNRNRVLHTIGNLTLLKEKLNEKLSNAPWSTQDGHGKRASLQQHGLMRLNSTLAACAVWDEHAIAERSANLFKHATRIWPRPESYCTTIR